MRKILIHTATFLIIVIGLVPFSRSDERLSLDGRWLICYSNSTGIPPDNSRWSEIILPATVRSRPERFIWFKRSFELPRIRRGRRVYLHFGGVKYVSKVFLNGREVGGHFGGWEPFEIDITSSVRKDENLIAVRVQDVRGVLNRELPYKQGRAMFEGQKNIIMAPVGSRTMDVGIWQNVYISIRHPQFIDDVFIKTSVRRRQIEVELTIKNDSDQSANGKVRCRILDQGEEVLRLEGDLRPMEAKSSIKKVLVKRWENPKLWSPLSPYLYTMRVELLQDGEVVDTRDERFGFREFWIDGIYFVLNGKRIKFLATAGHPPANSTRKDAENLFRAIKSANCVAMRLHANLWPEWWYEVADEMGILLVEESAIWCFAKEYALSKPEFWENARKHLAGMVRRDKNHPSVVIYSVENEILHTGGTRVRDCEEKLAELGRFLKVIDPTRPIMYDGDEDPGGVADIINLHYPHEFPQWNLYPNTCYWLEKRVKVSGYPRKEWRWSRLKPLYIGEFLWSPGRTPDPFTLFVGDEAYRDFNAGRAKAKAMAWLMQIQGYRALDVAGMCPWTLLESGRFPNVQYDAVKYAYEPNAAFIKEYDSRFFEKEEIERTIYLYNDTYRSAKLKLKWELWDGRRRVDSGSRKFQMDPADKIVTRITLHMPKYRYPGLSHPLRLVIKVEEKGEILFRDIKNYRLFPRKPRPIGNRFKVAVYDRGGDLAKFLRESGFDVVEIGEPWEGEIPASVCVIGAHMLDLFSTPSVPTVGARSDPGGRLREFVRRGGVLVVLEQNLYPSNMFPVSLTDYACTIAFKRADPGGLFLGIGDDDFKFWRGDNIVAGKMIAKPNHGSFRTIVDSGGSGGLIHAGVIEVPMGRGRYLLSQLLIGGKLQSEPIAGRFLLNLVDYACRTAAQPSPRHVLALIGRRLSRDLERIDLKYKLVKDIPLPQDYPLLMVDGPELGGLSDKLEGMRSYIRRGGTLILHAIEPKSMKVVNRLLPRGLVLQKSKAVPVLIEEKDDLIAGLSNQELYWLGPHTGDWRSRTPLDPGIIDYIPAEPLPPLEKCDVIEAERMKPESKFGLTITQNGMHMYAASSISAEYEFPKEGRYILGIFAGGTPVEGVYPEVTIYLDGERIAGIMLTHGEEDIYYVSIRAPQGRHTLSFAFTNDAYAPERGEDRNLFLDKVAIAPLKEIGLKEILNPSALVRIKNDRGMIIIDQINWHGKTGSSDKAARYLSTLMTNLRAEFRDTTSGVIIDAASMEPQPNIKLFKRVGRGVRFGTNGYVTCRVNFASTDSYIFEITARGTKAEGVYPAIKLSLDEKSIGEGNLQGEGWQTLRYKADVKRGVHRIKIEFTNDLWRPPEDRNLEVLQMRIYRLVDRSENR
ncbi:hypothetical protein J7M22_13315 [Candidatus Poribacteria bacterium]|nr:hypothetical protein [Candidatus Poribacteria bacterium]